MKPLLLIFLLIPLYLFPQSGQSDTISARHLDEIIVQAPKVVRKPGMDIYYPTKNAVENSKNGFQTIRNLMIPSIYTDEMLGTIKSAGKDVEIRINGRKSSANELNAILPKSIKRIEWIDNPGLRYNGASAVLNVIVANPELGGSLMTSAAPALNCAWGKYFLSAKLNNGHSQWELNSWYRPCDDIGLYREYNERFTYPDGQSVTRDERPIGGEFSNPRITNSISYSYIRPDTTIVYLSAGMFYRPGDKFASDGILSLSNDADNIRLNDIQKERGITPSASLYFEQHLPSSQIIVADMSYSFISGNSSHIYTERDEKTSIPITDVLTSVNDRNHAFGIEVNYIKKWAEASFTAGASYTVNRNRSTYENLEGKVFRQRQDKVYFFGEYFRRIGKISLTAGLGTQYSSFSIAETEHGNSSWNFRPRFSAAYAPNNSSQFKLNFSSWQTSPSLSETNIAPQQIDGFQWSIGNPDLHASSSYMLSLTYSLTIPHLMTTFGIDAFASPDAITPYMYWDNDRLITSYENSRGLKNLSAWISAQIEVVPQWLNLSGTVRYRTDRMKGTDYSLSNNNLSGNVMLQLSHWRWSLNVQYENAPKLLFGEKINWGESVSIISLNYNWRRWGFGAGMIMPFGEYDMGSKMLNRYNSNESHMRLKMRIPFLQISYNMNWGKQKQRASKLINVDANVEQSQTAGK